MRDGQPPPRPASGRAPLSAPRSAPRSGPIVTLLTDFGTDDYFVAAMKAVILRRAADARFVDITHHVPPGAIATGAFLLGAVADEFPQGTVHLVVVDPGVGSDRRRIAVHRDGSYWVGPDNGVLSPVLAGAEVRSIDRADLHPPRRGATFDGRDRFAPAAAALANGDRFAEIGATLDDPVVLELDAPRQTDDGRLVGVVLHVDRFGNAMTNLPGAWLDGAGELTLVGISEPIRLRCVEHYSELASEEPGVLVSSLGTIELTLDRARISDRFALEVGKEIIFAMR